MGQLDGKIALVTGSSTGIGRAVALLFGAEGADVIVTSNSSVQEGKDVCKQLVALGSDAMYVQADLGNKEDVENLFNQVKNKYGKLDVLINNAGRTYNVPFEEIDEYSFERDINVNLTSVMLCTQDATKLMEKGWIVNTASIRGLSESGRPGIMGYCAAKAAVISLTKNLSMQLAPRIFVNAVAPGFVYTNYMNSVSDEMKEKWLNQIPIRRFIEPEEIAKVYLMLSTSQIFTGSVIVPDGGYTLLGR